MKFELSDTEMVKYQEIRTSLTALFGDEGIIRFEVSYPEDELIARVYVVSSHIPKKFDITDKTPAW